MIESKDNRKIKYLSKLRNNKFMNEEKKFVIEGKHLVKEAQASGILLETYSILDTNYGVTNNLVTKDIMKHISDLPSMPSVIGVCNFMDEKESFGNKVIILDNVQDPGNVGTIIRCAKAFGFNSVILSNTTAKKYSQKVIRASQGMIFKMNVVEKDIKDFIVQLKKDDYVVYGTNVTCGTDLSKVSKNRKMAVVMGNEGSGISSDVSDVLDKNIYIKMKNECESLNVAVAAGIIMYELGD